MSDRKAPAELKLRLREDLRAKIEKASLVSGVSMNAEMCRRLENSFNVDEIAARFDRFEAILKEPR